MTSYRKCPRCNEPIDIKYYTCIYCYAELDSDSGPDGQNVKADNLIQPIERLVEEDDLVVLTTRNHFGNLKKPAKLVIISFWVLIVVDFFTMLANINQLKILNVFADGFTIGESAINSNDLWIGITTSLWLLTFIIASTGFLVWFYRSYKNLEKVKISKLQFTAKWTVWGFVVPIASLIIPYQIMKDIWLKTFELYKRSVPLSKSESVNNSILGWWWGLFLLSYYFGNIASRLMPNNETIEGLIWSTQIDLACNIIDIPAAIVLIILVSKISTWQRQLADIK
ncbi:MAG: DUF4328 domain-containing protein [candidate division Zixibacteria bacterium]|nr:DUF4328 domain-containing protein [candidate division Zixibacteria bacterium]